MTVPNSSTVARMGEYELMLGRSDNAQNPQVQSGSGAACGGSGFGYALHSATVSVSTSDRDPAMVTLPALKLSDTTLYATNGSTCERRGNTVGSASTSTSSVMRAPFLAPTLVR